jgi:hypothetical protein
MPLNAACWAVADIPAAMDVRIAMAFQFTRSFLRITQKQYAKPVHEVNNSNGNFAEGAAEPQNAVLRG